MEKEETVMTVDQVKFMRSILKQGICNQETVNEKIKEEKTWDIMQRIMKWNRQILLTNTQEENPSKMSTMIWEERPSNTHQEITSCKIQTKTVRVMKKTTLKDNTFQKMEDTPIDKFSSL